MRIIRTAFLLGVLTLFLMMGGSVFWRAKWDDPGLGIAICTNAFAYFFSDKIALLSSGARPVSREELPRLYAVMERLAAKANLPVPQLYVISGSRRRTLLQLAETRGMLLCSDEGLLQLMNDDELEGVIAHELSHVRNYDILISSIAATLAEPSPGSHIGALARRRRPRRSRPGWRLGHPRAAPIFSGAPRRTAAATRSFASARVSADETGHGWWASPMA